ncbi:hypothetical protein B0T18DRAFT_413197 [Schizothecium vesticola]|uniref:Uncharacterized protein n=1 Tax=Schizothecium vesticola TaxID=314040 RepID=A0AA40EX52_9PEZI|nr:hypothetical protein B0T18DRAFT_413197 [Schizothecium vesticola]
MSEPVKKRRHLQLVPISELGACDPSGRRIQVARDPRAPQQVRDGVETWIETQRQHPNLILTSSASPPQVPAIHRGKEDFFLVPIIMSTPVAVACRFPIGATANQPPVPVDRHAIGPSAESVRPPSATKRHRGIFPVPLPPSTPRPARASTNRDAPRRQQRLRVAALASLRAVPAHRP